MATSTLGRWTAGTFAAGAGAAIWGLTEAHAYTVRYRTILMDRNRLPQGSERSERLRVLHLSDIHLMPYQRKRLRWLASLASTQPDLVVFTGDQVASEKSLPLLMEALAPLAGTPGAFVYGSNDYYKPHAKNPFVYFKQKSPASHIKKRERELPWKEMTKDLESFGWVNMNNARSQITASGWPIELVGVDDPHIELDEYPVETSSSAQNGVLKLGLTHAPYTHILDQMAREGCAAVFAGHTHGGQVCVPGYGALVTNCDLDPKHASGLFQWPPAGEGVMHGDGIVPSGTEPRPTSWVNVSAGIGTSPTAPVRVACRPEAIVLDFQLV